MSPSSRSLDPIEVTFDDARSVSDAGMILPATLAQHLGLESLVNEVVDLGDARGHFQPGRKVMTLVHSLVAGGDCIDDADVLRSGSTGEVLGHRVMAPSTLGTFLRSFTFGHVRQLDAVAEAALGRAWATGAGPGADPLTIDVDSTICEVHGYQKQGAGFGYTRKRGYHPLLATRSGTGEVLHCRMRKGSANTARGADRFIRETLARVRRCGATGEVALRADSGFFSKKVVKACKDHKVAYSITVNANRAVTAGIEAIDEDAWVPIDYTAGGEAQVAETTYWGVRLVVRRTRLRDPKQLELWPNWRHHAFITDRVGSAVDLDAEHRRHATVETAIRDLKEGSGLCHLPSGRFGANSAWLVLCGLAHNLLRWVAAIGLGHAGDLVAKTMRRQLLRLPGRMTRGGRRRRLHLPKRWPWAEAFNSCLEALRCVRLAI